MNNNLIFQHFRPEEAPLIKNFSNLIEECNSEYRPILTDFLNPRERLIIKALLHHNLPISFSSYGLFQTSERQRGIFFPDYFQPQPADFALSLLEISYASKFSQLRHSQILGALLGNGLKRSVIGDIVTDGQRWQVVVEQQVVDFLQLDIVQIGKTKVRLQLINFEDAIEPKIAWQQLTMTVSSLRIDNLVSSTFQLSRAKAKELFTNGKVQLNWRLADQPQTELQQEDLVSVRGFGRFKLAKIGNFSKRGRLHVETLVLKK